MHPSNGSSKVSVFHLQALWILLKLFFAFAIEKILEPKAANRENLLVREKAKKQFVELFELTEKSVASINGRAWKRYNPEYLQNIRGY